MDRDKVRLIRHIRCVLFAVFLINTSFSNATSLDEAVNLYHQGDFQLSHQALLALSENNNADAYFLLGKMHERGDGVYRDEARAIINYQRAAALGLEAARKRIDQLRDNENSIVIDWYLESAWDGDIESAFNLGYLYERGVGIRIDESLALQWYEEAAGQQHADAQLRLGLMLIVGAGVEVDRVGGKRWLLEAAANGNSIAQAFDDFLFNKQEKINFLKLVRGIRTIDHTHEAKILNVLKSFVTQNEQPFALSLLNEKSLPAEIKPLKSAEKSTYIDVGGNQPLIKQSPMSSDPTLGADNNFWYWTMLAIIVIIVFALLFYYFAQNKFRVYAVLRPKKQKQLVFPAFKMNRHQIETVPTLSVSDKLDSRQGVYVEAVRLGLPNSKCKSINFIDETDISGHKTLAINSPRPNKVSYDDLLPKHIVDLQMKELKASSTNLLVEMKITQMKVEARITRAKQQELKKLEMKKVAEKIKQKSYIDEQTKEFAAAKVNDIEAVSDARLNIGKMFLQGDGVVINIPLAIKWLQRSADQANVEAIELLDQVFLDYPEHIVEEFEFQRASA